MHYSKLIINCLLLTATVNFVAHAQLQPGSKAEQVPGRSLKDEKKIDPVIKIWYLNGYGAFKDSTKLDTLQDFFHIYHPVYKNVISTAYLGNYATPYQDNDFFGRESNLDFIFLRTREAYMITPAELKYYNTRTPYTLLDFTQSENRSRKNETRFNVLHTQNINPYLNFVFRFDQARSMGQYKNQSTNNNSVTLYSNYNKDNFNIHGGFITSSIKNRENGGFTEDRLIFDKGDTDFLNVNLISSASGFGSTYIFTTGEYKFGTYLSTALTGEEADDTVKVFKPFAGILYSFEYQNHYKEFIDEEDSTNNYFPERYYDLDYTKDSIRFGMVKNIIQVKQYENPDRKTSFGKRAFIGQEFVRIAAPGAWGGTDPNRIKKHSNVYAGGGIFRRSGRFWQWNAEGRVFLLGRNTGQTELSGLLKKPLRLFGDSASSFNLNGKIVNIVPDYFQEQYFSNHIRWQQNLRMEQRMTVKANLSFPARRFQLWGNYAVINNFIFNDTTGIPTQHDGQLLVLSAFADKDFNFRNLHLRTRLLWQKSSNENILHLPDFSTFISSYYKFVVSKVLHTQIGVDLRYFSGYFADKYDPSTGLFYLQDYKKVGDYPYIDAYVNLRLKRTRVFFKMINLGTGFFNKEYFTTPHYPMNRMTFRMGFSWAFYD